MLYLAEQPEDKVVTIGEVSSKRDIPRGFLAKIFQALARAGLVYSTQGNTGGFMLGKPKDRITLRGIVEAVDGPVYLQKCLAHSGECNRAETCSVRQIWMKAQQELLKVLEQADLDSLTSNKPGNLDEASSP
jgi:Rrf2 family protein